MPLRAQLRGRSAATTAAALLRELPHGHELHRRRVPLRSAARAQLRERRLRRRVWILRGGTTCVAGTCRCEANCAGRSCGDDGCGGSCGSCPGSLSCIGGACGCEAGTTACAGVCCAAGLACVSGRCCAPSWRRTFSGVFAEGLSRASDGTLWIAGRVGAPASFVTGDRAWISSLDACGTLTSQTSWLPSSMPRATATHIATRTTARVPSSPLAIVGFGGADGNLDGLVSTLMTSPVRVTRDITLPASGSDDLYWQSTQSPDGLLWSAGQTNSQVGTCASVSLASPSTGTVCTWNIFSSCIGGGTFGTSIGHDGGVWFTGAHGNSAFVARYPSFGCAATPGCTCAPTLVREFGAPGTVSTTGRSVVAGSARTLVAGYAFLNGTDAAAVVMGVTADGTVSFGSPWNPTTIGDAFLGAAFVDGPSPTLYAVGLRGWDGLGNTAFAQGVLAAYDANTLTQRWVVSVPNAGGCWGVVGDDAGGVIVACGGSTSSTVRRCTSAGVCPP
ncbi:MAG: hypothetical protein R3A48_11465 [Polyangiales bacterium]